MDGEFNIARWQGEPSLLNQRVCKISTSCSKTLNSKYLYYALPKKLKEIEARTSFVTVKHLSVKEIKNIDIPLPSLHIQQQIADTLDKADALRQKDQQLLQKYDELAQSIFYDMFGDPVRNERDWKVAQIGTVCSVTKLAGYEYTEHIKYLDKGEIIVVKGLNVKNETLLLNNVQYISIDTSNFLSRSKLNCGDVVMTYIGINIGDVAIIEENDKYHLAPNVSKIVTKDKEVLNPFFLLKYLSLNRRLFTKYTTNTAKQALNMGNIREIAVILPPILLQKKYERII